MAALSTPLDEQEPSTGTVVDLAIADVRAAQRRAARSPDVRGDDAVLAGHPPRRARTASPSASTPTSTSRSTATSATTAPA